MTSTFVAILVSCVIAAAIAQPLPSSSSAAPPAVFSCEGLVIGQHAAAVNACESYFYQCPEGFVHGIRLNCTENTFFDDESKQCLYAADVVACGGVATTTTTTSTAATTTTTKASTTSTLAPTTTTSATTTTAAPTTTTAAPTTTTAAPTTTTAAPTTTVQSDEVEKFDCTNKKDDIYASELNKCSHVYWSCSNGDAYMHTCPGELEFDIVSKTCLESEFITACGGESTTTVSQTTKAPINDPIFATACKSLTAGYYSDPRPQYKTDNGTCSQAFMVCTGSSPVAAVYQCPSDLYYDEAITACNYHAETTACTGVAPASTTPIPESNVKEAPEGTCEGKIGGNYDLENGTCSHEYVSCANDGRGWIFTCPSDLYFDVEYNRCEYKEYIPICSGSPRPDFYTTTTKAEETTTTVAPPAARRR